MPKNNEIDLNNLNISEKDIIKFLKSLGKIDSDFKYQNNLIEFTVSSNKEIRYLAVQNLAKLSNEKYLSLFEKLIKQENTSKVRREIASAIGRLRSEKSIPIMINLLEDKDPNVILQSIRGLLIFKQQKDIFERLINLRNHKNEIVRKVIEVEFFDQKINQKNHHKSPDILKNCILNGDVYKIIKKIENESIHLTFTSPPYYNARDYSIYDSYESYLKFLEKVFTQVHRITKEGRFFILNTSPIIIPRVGRKYSSRRYPIPYDLHNLLTKMGWEFIDDIFWVKPEPSVKNRVAGFNIHRKPLAYKPNSITECLMVYRKKSNKLIDWIYKQYPDEIIEDSKVINNYETNNIWKIDPRSNKVHSAIFPKELCDRVIKYYSFKGDLVFDPFAGSGSVGLAAKDNGRYFFMTEINKTYYKEMVKIFSNDLFSQDTKFKIK